MHFFPSFSFLDADMPGRDIHALPNQLQRCASLEANIGIYIMLYPVNVFPTKNSDGQLQGCWPQPLFDEEHFVLGGI